MDRLVKGLAAVSGLLALASWAGPLHPAGDALAVLRVPLVVLAALAVIWSVWPRHIRWPAAGLCLIALAQVGVLKLHASAPGPFTVYQKNLWYGNPQAEALAAEIIAQAPDVVTLQEVSARNARVLDLLRPSYPHQYSCATEAVLSRHPVVAGETRCLRGGGMAGLRLSLPDGPVWVLSVHLVWPWPYGQRRQADQLVDLVAGLEGPVVLAGDFNMVPWGSDPARLVRAAAARRAGPMAPTFWLRHGGWPLAVPLPLDQVYAPGGGQAAVRPLLGSDHAGVLARVSLDVD